MRICLHISLLLSFAAASVAEGSAVALISPPRCRKHPFFSHSRSLSKRPPPFDTERVQQRRRRGRRQGQWLRQRTIASTTMVLSGTSLAVALGGCLAGGLHAISGPDHLAAVLPPCIGQRWWNSSRIGVLWALGHGLTASFWGFADLGQFE